MAVQLLERALRAHGCGDTVGAEHFYRRVLSLTPDQADALHYLGLICQERGQGRQAIELLRRSVAVAPGNPRSWNSLGGALRETGRLLEAVAAYREAIARDPDYVNALYNLAVSLLESGEPGEAAICFESALKHAPRDAELWNGLGDALRQLRRVPEAINALRKAGALDPACARARGNLGLALMDAGQVEEAVASYREALAIEPDMVAPLVNLARARRATDDDRLALEARLAGGDVDEVQRAAIHFALGEIYDQCGRFALAFEHVCRAGRLMSTRRHFNAARHSDFVGRVIRTFSAELLACSAVRDTGSDLPVFIVGMPRSGTSLVEQIVASHTQVHGAGELSCIHDIMQNLSARSGSDQAFPECAPGMSTDLRQSLAQEYLLEASAGAGQALRITDKMPMNFLHLGLIAQIFPRARIVHCVRDVRDLFLSNLFQAYGQGLHYSYRAEDFVRYYREYRRLMRHWRRVLPLPVHEVRYEELVASQEPVSRALIAFCGLEWDPRCMAFHTTRRSVQTASHWQVRQPMYSRSAGRWKHYADCLRDVPEVLAMAEQGE